MNVRRPTRKRERSTLLGLAFDAEDNQKRITRGPNFLLAGGSQETHGVMQETAVKINEHPYEPFREKLLASAKSLKMGYGLDEGVTLGPVVSARAKERVTAMIDSGKSEGAALLLDGRGATVADYPKGSFVGPTVFDGVEPSMRIGHEEIFGPVASVMQVEDLDDAIAKVHASGLANATSIFTTSGRSAREFRYHVGVSMIGVNIGVAAPMAFFPFGGTKGSFYGDLKAHGHDSVQFYTDKKVVISRW